MSDDAIALIVIFGPFVAIFAMFAYLHISTRESYSNATIIDYLRKKVQILPYDKKTIEERLKVFDEICAKVKDHNVKIMLLGQLAQARNISELEKSYHRPRFAINQRDSDQNYGWQEMDDDSDFLNDYLEGRYPCAIRDRRLEYMRGYDLY